MHPHARRAACGIAAASWLLVAARAARADEPAQGFTPDFLLHDIRLEPVAIAAALLPELGLLLPQSHAGGPPDAGRHTRQSGAATASDVTLVSGLVLVIAGAGASEAARDGGLEARHLRAPLVVAEAVLLGSTATQIPKRAVGRCRPYDWDDGRHACDASTDGDDAFKAMWSGHAATLAAGAGAASCLAVREGRFGWPAVLAITGEALAATTSALRVAAGAHSWSDVAIGFGAGNLLGVGMCLAHPTTPRGPVALTATARAIGLRIDLP